MSWFSRFKRTLPPQPDVAKLRGEELADERARTEIEKMRVETIDERSWRTKLLLSLVVPVVAALAFLNTWYSDHAADRQHRSDQLYTDAAQQLSSNDASVRLNAILTLGSFVTEQGWLTRTFDTSASSGDCGKFESVRGRQSVALIIGQLVDEQEASVLDAIAKTADEHPCLTIEPLLSVDRSAAVQFARAAGTFAGQYILRTQNVTSVKDGKHYRDLSQQAIEDISAITMRTGSPFEAKDMMNESFVSRTFFANKCPFLDLYDKQLRLTMSVGLRSPLLARPPSAEAIQTSLKKMEDAAAVLEKSSYVLAQMADTSKGLLQIQRSAAQQNLYGTAIVVGEITPSQTIADLRSLGAYVQQLGVEGTCSIPQQPTAK